MKQTLTIAFMLVCATISAQDTLCVMVCLDEVINFNYKTSEIINRYDHEGDVQLKVNEGEVLCLHLFDEKNRFRDVTTTFSESDHTHNTFASKDNAIYTNKGWGSFTVDVSKARRRK
jgi:hypothetical protein|tara:strand:+ start:500 stop:850 length:351 start_codon:yes stop_codon:yes gene_type:complete